MRYKELQDPYNQSVGVNKVNGKALIFN